MLTRTQDLLDHLEKLMVLSVVNKYGSIRKASEQLGISQPSLSIKIKNLEEILGFNVFQRNKSGIQVTQRGQMLLDFVNRTENNAEELKLKLQSSEDSLTGHVRVGIYDSIARYFWPPFYKRLKKKYPGIAISLVTGRSHDIMTKLSRQELEIALTVEPTEDKSYFQKTLYTDYFSCYGNTKLLNKSDSFVMKKGQYELSSQDSPYDLIVFSEALRNISGSLNKDQVQIHEVENFEIALEFCLQEIGLVILPHRVAESYYEKGTLNKVRLSKSIRLNFNQHKIALSINKNVRSQAATSAIFEEFSF